MSKAHRSNYDDETTARCERALVTLLGDIGPWSSQLYLVGGLAPRYLIGTMPDGAAHVGTTDVDLVIRLSIENESSEAYRTLESNLRRSGFEPENSFRWTRQVDEVTVTVEFLCETDAVEPGRIYKPKLGTGSNLGAFNVRGAQLVARDWVERDIEQTRLDDGGLSKATVRVAAILPYVALKVLAFQDRHENKDAYDLVYCLLHFRTGPTSAGRVAASSPVREEPAVRQALDLLAQRFASVDHDGPRAYAAFLTDDSDDIDTVDRTRREAVAVVRQFLDAV